MTIVLENIRGGGAPFSAVNWANAWQRMGHDVTIVAVHPNEGQGEDFTLQDGITLVRLDLQDQPVKNSLMALKRLWRCLSRLRRVVRDSRPDLALSFAAPINVRMLMACLGLRFPKIVMEQTHPGMESHGLFWEKWRVRLYPRATALVNLTQEAHGWCLDRFRPARTAVIPNPVLPAQVPGGGRPPGKRIVAAGRMVEQKRFDILLDAFAKVARDHPEWTLMLYGEGPNRAELERQVAQRELGGRVEMPGWANDLSSRMSEGDFFVLSSGYEGFGNVIGEAMAVGLPVVSFNCPSGPSDIIRHGVDGLLVPPLDVDALASSMEQLMVDESLRKRLASRAPEVLDRFSLQSTLEKWDALFSAVGVRS
jgi:glycosyltransferase involved in cell wall biosynthesis